jgi:hypothetical protein
MILRRFVDDWLNDFRGRLLCLLFCSDFVFCDIIPIVPSREVGEVSLGAVL